MSYADEVFIANCKDILENGTWDTDYNLSLIHISEPTRPY